MAQMQICLAATYRKYYTRISPRTTDAMMEVDDGITSAGPIVCFSNVVLIIRHTTAGWNSTTQKTCRKAVRII